MDVRTIEATRPRLEHEGSTKVWWLSEAREFMARTAGGHLELIDVFEVAGGGAVHPHKHPTYEFYYVTSGYGLMTIEEETRQIGPGDLVVIPPDALHSLTTLSPHAPIVAFCFAVGLPGSDAYDYSNDHPA
ncbi:MAG TPA: cupin domain-containing protein [Chloroflexota bacterium]|jgi:quercetin dioxygenase-like cupin family protein|nr:cupin domain-containing protein [Chloroflexota bacterium]